MDVLAKGYGVDTRNLHRLNSVRCRRKGSWKQGGTRMFQKCPPVELAHEWLLEWNCEPVYEVIYLRDGGTPLVDVEEALGECEVVRFAELPI